MKQECTLCIRDNFRCLCGKSFFSIIFGKVSDCMVYDDYHKNIIRKGKKK